MEISKIIYEGNLRTQATHLASGAELVTDAPKDNEGLGMAFSPTDLLAVSLGSCIVTVMGIHARKHSFEFNSAHLRVSKTMGTNPRRVIKVKVEIDIPGENLTVEQRNILEKAGIDCPVAKSLHPEIEQEIIFKYS